MSNKILFSLFLFITICVIFFIYPNVSYGSTGSSYSYFNVSYGLNDNSYCSNSKLCHSQYEYGDSNSLAIAAKSNTIFNKLDFKGLSVKAKAVSKAYKSSTKAVNTYKRPTALSQTCILNASVVVDRYISKNKRLPDYVKIAKVDNNYNYSYKFSMPEFLYLLSKTIQNKHRNISSKIAKVTIKYDVKSPARPKGLAIDNELFSYDELYYAALEVSDYIDCYNVAPNNISYNGLHFKGEIQYQTIIYCFIKLLTKESPTNILINISNNSKINGYIPKYTRPGAYKSLNDKYTGESLKNYLKQTKNCQVSSKLIKSLSKKITQSCRSKLQRAIAIYNWIVDNIRYEFYYNTRYGAESTIAKGFGNCVDQSHLFIALCRSSGLPARYVYVKSKFIGGTTNGHVFSQVLVDKKWIAADTSSYEFNNFGVINYWDTKSYKLYGKYSQLLI